MELGKATRKLAVVSQALAATVDDKKIQHTTSGLVGTENNQEKLENDALASAWVYSNIDVISKLVSHTPIGVWQIVAGEESKPIANHEFEMLLRNPNPFMGSSFFKRYLVMWLLLRGEAYVMLAPDKSGKLVEMWPLPSDQLEPIPDERNYIKGYWMKNADPTKPPKFIPSEYICYIRLPNPKDYHRGLSPLSAFSMALETDKHAATWNFETFTNEAVLRTLISVPPNISRGQFSKIKDEIVDELIGKGKRYMVARGGQLNVSQLGLSHKDMEYLRGREFTREEIDRVYGFPAGFWAKEATEANSRTARETLIELAIWPVLTLLSEEFKAQVIDRYYPMDELEDAQDSIVALEVRPEDIRARNVELETAAMEFEYQTMTINEVRTLQGRTPYTTAFGEVPWSLRDKEDYVMAILQSRGEVNAGIDMASFPGITTPDIPLLEETTVPDQGNTQVAVNAPSESGLLVDDVRDERFTNAKAIDLKTWQKLNIKSLRKSGTIKDRFNSDHLDEDEIDQIKDELKSVGSIPGVRQMFRDAEDWLQESAIILFSDWRKKKAITHPENLPSLTAFDTVETHFQDIFREQYESIDVKRFRDLDTDSDIEDWVSRVAGFIPAFSSLLNRDILADNMIEVADEGLESVIETAVDSDVDFDETDTAAATEYARQYIEDRIDALSGDTPRGADTQDDVRNPWLDSGIDAMTALGIAYLLRRSLRGNFEDETAWASSYTSGIAGAIKSRANLLTWNNLGRAFANGIIGFVARFTGVQKTWLETSSLVPRDDHLSVVGETVPYNDNFSHGQFWSQESINCKCGVAISFS